MEERVISMTEEQLHDVVVQARRLLLNPGATVKLPMDDAAALLITLARALCQVAPVELLVPSKPRLVPPASPDRLDVSSKPVTVSSH
jgi:hypothetical protein